MKKRLIAGALALMMTAGLATGCGSSEKKKDFTEIPATDNDGENPPETDGRSDVQSNGAGEEEQLQIPDVNMTDNMLWEAESWDTDAVEAVEDGWYNGYNANLEQGYWNTEEYGEIVENGFLSAEEQPLSTFSADVDTASYSNLRRMILNGYEMDWIPDDSVRIEEMLNYFSYDYEEPEAGEPFGVNTEIAPCPWNEDSYLLMVGLRTEAVDFSEAAPSNLVFLIDVSGSMYSDDKLPLLQQSFAMLVSNLSAKDRVSIVTYAGEDRVVLEGAAGNDARTIISALESLQASGSTNGSAGIETAYELAEEYFIPGGNNRIILATDGDLNVGLTSEEELEELISRKRDTGIFLSVLGFGTGNIKDNKMELLADKGNGNYAYIDSLNEARKVLVEEMGATLVTVAKDVKLQMVFNPEIVSEYRLIGYENRALADEDFSDDTKDGGEIGAGHSVTVLYEIRLADSGIWNSARDAARRGEWCTLHIRYKEPEGSRSRQLDYPIGAECLGSTPSEDILFAGCVAQLGMIIRDSDYKGNATLESIVACLRRLDNVKEDEYKEEFLELVEELLERENHF